ncbi:MAG: STAS domain-containing protein [Desulfonauticus sp.]|nr:STAS domain-containing protein [Desulfonauticus sp.]
MEKLLVEKNNEVYLVKIVGELEIDSVEKLKPKLEAVIESDRNILAIDLSEITFMDSTGIGFLVALNNKLKRKGKKLVLVKPSVQVIKTLKLINIYHFFDQIEDIDKIEDIYKIVS